MNELEQLNERIAQLTELVKTGSEAIKSMKAALEAAEKERDGLADQRREQEPKFKRVEFGHGYYYVALYSGGLKVCKESEDYTNIDNGFYINNNYFHTKERAREVADKINLLLKLERLHDTFCPEYKFDYSIDTGWKYYVIYHHSTHTWTPSFTCHYEYKYGVYFPTEEIAQKVCDILNAELKEQERNCNE